MKSTQWIVILILGLTLLSCTKDRVQKDALKYEVYPKAMIDGSAEYLYVPSTLATSRHALFGRAFELGEQRVVQLELGEFTLNVYAVDREKKFADNPANKKLLLSIPVEHVDYRCADDAFGECLSEEVEDTRLKWNEKKHFRPKFDQAKVTDPNVLPSDLPDDCFSVKETKLAQRKMEPNAINFRLERNYQNQPYFFCNRALNELSDLNWSNVTHYSIVKLDTITSPNYQKLVYTPDWTNTFGFFEQNDFQLDVDGNSTQQGEIKYVSRWNPQRTEVLYYLSAEFEKPENKVLKAATLESIKRVNMGLRLAGINFEITTRAADSHLDVGDLRNSMIILAEDPFEASVIGYGPSITHPRTGEILSARVVMYSGSLKKFIRYTYDEILRLKGVPTEEAPASPSADLMSKTVLSQKVQSHPLHHSKMSSSLALQMTRIPSFIDFQIPTQVDRTPRLTELEIEQAARTAQTRDFIAQLSRRNMYPAEMLSFGDISQDVIEQVIKSIGELKPWETLSDDRKQAVLDVLTPYVWIPTLVHEMGHNLGLRHNFSGSEDKDNFYSNEELSSQNLPVSSRNVPYSSVMDYPKSEINALRAFGKYDIAALRFGYTLKATNAEGKVVTVDPNKSPAGLREFSYCSDEGVAPNPNCNPFDEGSQLTEITQSLIDGYKEGYLRSNFRRGRANFSSLDDDFYYSRVQRVFSKMRLVYERYESIVREFQVDQKTIDEVPFLKDLDEAVVIAGDFLMSTVTEPDTLCIIGLPDQSLQAVPIGIFSELAHNRTRSCFDLQLNEGFSVVAQGGKNLNSMKLPSNPNRYADQIDIRGTWIDKTLAMKALFQRKLNSSLHDRQTGNFTDHPKVASKLLPFVENLLNDKTTVPVEFKTLTGEEIAIPIGVSRAMAGYEIPAPELPIVSRALGVRYDNLHILEAFASILRKRLQEGGPSTANHQLIEALTVRTVKGATNNPNASTITIADHTLYTEPNNVLAHAMMKKTVAARILENTSPETLKKVLEHLQKKSPEGLNAEEKGIYDLGVTLVQDFIEGRMAPSGFYAPILLELAGV